MQRLLNKQTTQTLKTQLNKTEEKTVQIPKANQVFEKKLDAKNQTQIVAQNSPLNSTGFAVNQSSQAQKTSASNTTLRSIHPAHFKSLNQTLQQKRLLKLPFASNSSQSQLSKSSRLHLSKQLIQNSTAQPLTLSKLNPYGDFSTFEQSVEEMKPIGKLEEAEIIKRKLMDKLANKMK